MTDDEIIAAARAAFEVLDPVPRSVLAAARGAYRWREPGATLAELSDDSGLPAAGLRHGEAPRLLTFGGADVVVEVEVTAEDGAHRVVGRLLPPAPAQVRLRHPDGELVSRADPAGQFVLDGVPAGLVSLVFRLADRASVVTSWVRL